MVHKYVNEYIREYEDGKILFNKERIDLVSYLRKSVFSREDLYFDEIQIDQCVRYIEKWFFPLQSFQKFIICFLFLKRVDSDRLHYRKILIMMGRGGGKNGLLSGITNYLTSELHGIDRYDVSIVANSEEQAKTSFEEIYDVIDSNEQLKRSFDLRKVKITNKSTRSILRFRTSNAGTKDGGREGVICFDEIHRYLDAKTVNVLKSGLGKVKHPREIYIGTDGYVREGFLDNFKEQANAVLRGDNPESNLFPFLCKLDNPEQVNDHHNWELANPMFCSPISEYAENLYETVKEEFVYLEEDPSGKEEFMTKRMNLPEVDLEKSVASIEEIKATNKPIPDFRNKVCVGGLDFASIRDFAAVGLLFKEGNEYIWKSHSFVRQGFLDSVKMKVPINKWEDDGLLTIVDEPTISISHIVQWFVSMREIYGLTTIVADSFRLDLVKTALEDEGFTLVYIRNPRAIHSLLAPRIETMFANKNVTFGDNQLMRWYVNNTLVAIDKFGNKTYLKKEETRRKTDGFQAFIHALFQADNVLEEEEEFMLADINF